MMEDGLEVCICIFYTLLEFESWPLSPFPSSKLFCLCLEFQFKVREILSIQSSRFLSKGKTDGNGYLEAEMVT